MSGFSLAEVAPAAPLLAPLTAYLACLVALGIILVTHQLVSALFGVAKGIVNQTVGRIPWIGGKISGSIHHIEQRVNNYLSQATNALEGAVSSSWHALAAATAHLGYTIAHLARATGHLAWYVLDKYSIAGLAANMIRALHLIRHLQQLYHSISRVVHTATTVIYKPTSIIYRTAVRVNTKGLEAEFDAFRDAVLPRLRAVEHAAARAVEGALPWAVPLTVPFGLTPTAIRRWLRRHERLLGANALTAAVAFALARFGATWIRCGNWNKVGKSVCALPAHLIEELFSGAIEAFVVSDLCDFIAAVSAAAHAFQPILLDFVDVEDALIGCHGATKPPALPLREAAPPQRQAYAALAAG